MGDRTYSVDANFFLADGAAAQTTSGYAQYAGADGLVDLMGNQNITITLPSIDDVSTITPQQPRFDGACVLDVTAINTSASSVYKIMLVGSNDPSFGSGNVQLLAMTELGIAASLDVLNGITTPAPPSVGGSRYELLFSNEQNNVKYEFVKLYLSIAGGSATITFRAFVAVLPRI